MRGRTRLTVAVVFTFAASASAALAGFAAGLPALAISWRPTPASAAGVALAAVLLDLAAMRPRGAELLGAGGRGPRPPSVRRQVPVEWSRLFAPPVVALLYGARLGVGPLTILPTWLWWAAFLLGAWLGPFAGVAVGLSFALARAVSILGLGMWVREHAARRMALLQGVERRAAVVLLAGATAATLAAFGS